MGWVTGSLFFENISGLANPWTKLRHSLTNLTGGPSSTNLLWVFLESVACMARGEVRSEISDSNYAVIRGAPPTLHFENRGAENTVDYGELPWCGSLCYLSDGHAM